jgi:hypothetical protein
MIGGSSDANAKRRWMDWDPARLGRDTTEVRQFAPDLEWVLTDEDGLFPYGGWSGALPLWPFDRAQPEGLVELVQMPLQVLVIYSSAHPVVSPTIYPIDPEPQISEISDTIWHVAPGQSLCLFQSEGYWVPEASVRELLLKACGWRIEYALMHAGIVDRMSERGIVTDASFDHLITRAAHCVRDGCSGGGE